VNGRSVPAALSRRTDLFLALPIDKLAHLALHERLRAIGGR
jgi:hypothetical protein